MCSEILYNHIGGSEFAASGKPTTILRLHVHFPTLEIKLTKEITNAKMKHSQTISCAY